MANDVLKVIKEDVEGFSRLLDVDFVKGHKEDKKL